MTAMYQAIRLGTPNVFAPPAPDPVWAHDRTAILQGLTLQTLLYC